MTRKKDGKVAITYGKEQDGKKRCLLSAVQRFDMKARTKLLSGLKIRAGTRPILLTSKPPPPGMIFPVVRSEAAAPP